MPAENILIIEDEKNIARLIKYNLEKAGFSCFTTITGEEAFDILDREDISLIILDVMLPKMDGFEFCRSLRQQESYGKVPVIMLTARGEEVDRIVGLELGADDYMVKPFSPRELVLRVKAILRRGRGKQESKKEVLALGKLKVDIPRHKVVIDKKPVELSPMEFKLLVTLLERRGRVQTRDALLNDVWGISADVTTRTVDTHVKMLRQKLGRQGKLVETVRGIGYRIADEE